MCGKKEPESSGKSSEEMQKQDDVVTMSDDEKLVEPCRKEGEGKGGFLDQKTWSITAWAGGLLPWSHC